VIRKLANAAIVPGLGWTLNTHSAPHLCDGSYDSFFGKEEQKNYFLSGQNDDHGGIFCDSYSGNLANLKHGVLVLRMEAWHGAGAAKGRKAGHVEKMPAIPHNDVSRVSLKLQT
jgi:hypothetical protein